MQISSRFTIAIHVLICIETFKDTHKVTSEFLASSVNTNPVVIRRILQQLKAAGMINVVRGSGGASIIKPLNEITLYDIYVAVECLGNEELFHFHENPNENCPVGRNIHRMLDNKLEHIQLSMENEMKSETLLDIINDAKVIIPNS